METPWCDGGHGLEGAGEDGGYPPRRSPVVGATGRDLGERIVLADCAGRAGLAYRAGCKEQAAGADKDSGNDGEDRSPEIKSLIAVHGRSLERSIGVACALWS